jgi:hypothetical protein
MTEKQEQIKESISLIKGFIFELYENETRPHEYKNVIEELSYALYLLESEKETEKVGDFNVI